MRTVRPGFRSALHAALVLALTLSATAAHANTNEEPSAADLAAARALGQEGVKLADAGKCDEAIDRLARAEKLFHAPTTLARLGECQVQVGKLVEGTENLNRVVRAVLPPDAPAVFVTAQERARQVLAEAKPKIANLKIAVAAPADAQLTVTIDGEPMPLANLNANRPIDPGEHVVEASAPGFKTATVKVHLSEGGIDSVALTLEPDPNAPKAAPGGADPSAEASSTHETTPLDSSRATTSSGPSRIPAYAALGLGAVGVGVGTVFGLMATGKKSDLDGACPDRQCGNDMQDTIDTGKTYGTVSTVGFVVGGVGILAGTYLLLTSGSSRASTTAQGPKVTPILGLGGGGLAGTF